MERLCQIYCCYLTQYDIQNTQSQVPSCQNHFAGSLGIYIFSILLVYFKIWAVAIVICFFYIFSFVLPSVPLVHNMEVDQSKQLQETMLSILVPTNLTSNSKRARHLRQASLYLHFVITVPILLCICFIDPHLVNWDDSDLNAALNGIIRLDWAELELSQYPIYKYLAVGLALGCGVFSVLVDMLFSIFW